MYSFFTFQVYYATGDCVSENPRAATVKTSVRHGTSRRQRRLYEDHLAMIFLGYILVFLVCHLPRILLDIHELVTHEHYQKCREAGLYGFPFYITIAIFISHITLVLSCATDLIIYCSLSSTYRQELCKMFSNVYWKAKKLVVIRRT